MRIQRSAAVAAALASTALAATMLSGTAASAEPGVSFELVGRYSVAGGAEVVAIDGARMFVLNGAGVDVVNIANPAAPSKVTTVDLSAYGAAATSVAASKGRVAVAMPNADKTVNGKVVILSAATGAVLAVAPAGALPDMVTFDKPGKKVLVANEGEPAYYGAAPTGTTPVADPDPEGSVTVIHVDKLLAGKKNAVRTIGFTDFNDGGPRAAELSDDVRIFGPEASVAEDLEPEYITVADDSAFVTLQENNAIAEIDLEDERVVAIRPLGLKDHSVKGDGLDPSNADGGIAIAQWPVFGMPLPDAVASFESDDETFLITANEGDARQDWPGFAEEILVSDSAYVLDPGTFTAAEAAALKDLAALGNLTVSSAEDRAGGDTDGDGDRDEIRAFGTRSATIWGPDGELVWDSGDLFEQVTADAYPLYFNSNNNNRGNLDNRSDNKGPEPEGVAVGKVDGRTLAFVVLERIGGFVVLDVTDPSESSFVQYANSRDFTARPGATNDAGPEVVRFVPAKESPSGKPLVVVANEISGTVTIWSPAS